MPPPALHSLLAPLRPLARVLDAPARRRLAAAVGIDDIRTCAKLRAPKMIFDYIDGAAEDEIALRRSRSAYSDIELHYNVLSGHATVDTRTQLFGHELAREGQRRFVVVDDATVAPRRRLGAFPRRHECFALLPLLVSGARRRRAFLPHIWLAPDRLGPRSSDIISPALRYPSLRWHGTYALLDVRGPRSSRRRGRRRRRSNQSPENAIRQDGKIVIGQPASWFPPGQRRQYRERLRHRRELFFQLAPARELPDLLRVGIEAGVDARLQVRDSL